MRSAGPRKSKGMDIAGVRKDLGGKMYTAGFVIYLFSLVIALANFAGSTILYPGKPGRFFSLGMMAAAFYSLGFLMKHTSADYHAALQATCLQYIGAPFVAPMLLFFVMDYCGIKHRLWITCAVLVIPVMTSILVFTYPVNGIYYGATYFVSAPVPMLVGGTSIFRTIYLLSTYVQMLLTIIICLFKQPNRGERRSRHSWVINFALSVPIIGNVITIAMKTLPVDLTPPLMCISGVLLFYSLLFTDMLRVAPLAREIIVETMRDGFILIDTKGGFLDANQFAKQLFPQLAGAPIGSPMNQIMGLSEDAKEWQAADFSVDSDEGAKHYHVSSNLVYHKGLPICTCVSIYDYTSIHGLMENLTLMAERDGLTNLMNRRAFFKNTEKRIADVAHYGGKAVLLMLDIDFFKRVNDTYGHLAGDEVLCAVGRVLENRLRSTDLVGRYGGEEFCAFLLVPGIENAVKIAEECRVQVENTPIWFEGELISVTVSIGIAEFMQESGETLTELVARADAALYAAKESGRNQSVLYE